MRRDIDITDDELNGDLRAVYVQREILDLPTLGKICGGIVIIALCGAVLLAPLALVLYLISWMGCR